MDIETISSNVEEFVNGVTTGDVQTEELVVDIAPQLTDVWQQRLSSQRNVAPTTVRGSRPKTKLDFEQLLQGGIQDAYKKALDDSELLRAEGDTARAKLVEQQYMQNYYYPVIDALVRLNSQEEVLANQDVLEALDTLAIVPGGGAADGYASVFVSSLYEPDASVTHSDAQVRQAVKQITQLCNSGQVRQAIGLAQRFQEQVDRGDNLATPADYALLQKIALRAQNKPQKGLIL